MTQMIHRLAHIHIRWVFVGLVFWVAQLVLWICMMLYVQLFNPKLGANVLYVTQISHWALVVTCGTAATATLGVLSSRVHHDKAAAERRD